MTEELLKALKNLKRAFKTDQQAELKQISGTCIHESTKSFDSQICEAGLIAYSLNKLLSKHHIVSNIEWNDIRNSILSLLDKTIEYVESDNIPEFESALEKISQTISETDKKHGYFLQSLEDKSKIKMASNAYVLGLSLSQAASLTGADKKELLRYIGRTRTHEQQPVTFTISDRLKNLKEILNLN